MMKSLSKISVFLLLTACSSRQDEIPKVKEEPTTNYTVTPSSVGSFTEGMTIEKALKLFPDKRFVKKVAFDDDGNFFDDHEFYSLKNEHLLTLTPRTSDNAQSEIESIAIVDSRYKTGKGIGLGSTYSELLSSHEITGCETDLESIVLIVGEINARFSISKKVLLDNWWDDRKNQVDMTKIPAEAAFEKFTIHWK